MGVMKNGQYYHGRITGSKNKTYRGVPIDEYKKAREVLDKESFDRWVLTVTGKPRRKGTNHFVKKMAEPADQTKVIDTLGQALRAEQYAHSDTNLALSICREEIVALRDALEKERNRSWLSRLFNLKG